MTGAVPIAHPTRQREALLLEYTRDLFERRCGRRVAWLHLSRLRARNRRDRHIRAAANGFSSLVEKRTAQVFVLSDADIVIVYDEDRHEDVRSEIDNVLYLFGEDPTVADDPAHARFVTWYDVDRDFDLFLRAVRARFDGRPIPPDQKPRSFVPGTSQKRKQAGDVMTPQMLEQIERVLATADLSNMMRRQTACAVAPDLAITPRFTELFVSIGDLRDAVLPDGNLAANPWLFRRLTQTLDRRVMSYLTAADSRFDGTTISVNVNVSTLLTGAFAVIDGGLAGAGPSAVAFELQSVDVFSDIAAFLFARDFAHQRGFRIFLDGMTWRELGIVRAGKLDIDMAKVVWDQAFAVPDSPQRRVLDRFVQEMGADRIVVSDADGRDAVVSGHEIGLRVFQGQFVDALLREDNRRRGLQRLKRSRLRDT